MQDKRYLGVTAGPFAVALPIESVRQILDAGSGPPVVPSHTLPDAPLSMARLLGAAETQARPALLLLDLPGSPRVLSVCALGSVWEGTAPQELPPTVVCMWPGLIAGTVEGPSAALFLVIDVRVLLALQEAQGEPAAAETLGSRAGSPAGVPAAPSRASA